MVPMSINYPACQVSISKNFLLLKTDKEGFYLDKIKMEWQRTKCGGALNFRWTMEKPFSLSEKEPENEEEEDDSSGTPGSKMVSSR